MHFHLVKKSSKLYDHKQDSISRVFQNVKGLKLLENLVKIGVEFNEALSQKVKRLQHFGLVFMTPLLIFPKILLSAVKWKKLDAKTY